MFADIYVYLSRTNLSIVTHCLSCNPPFTSIKFYIFNTVRLLHRLHSKFSNMWRIVNTILWLSKGAMCADARAAEDQLFSWIVEVSTTKSAPTDTVMYETERKIKYCWKWTNWRNSKYYSFTKDAFHERTITIADFCLHKSPLPNLKLRLVYLLTYVILSDELFPGSICPHPGLNRNFALC